MKVTRADLIVGLIVVGMFILSIGGCMTLKKATFGNGTIETEKLIKSRIK